LANENINTRALGSILALAQHILQHQVSAFFRHCNHRPDETTGMQPLAGKAAK
jgi:hypothetical protein